jgi:hypothetical protein
MDGNVKEQHDFTASVDATRNSSQQQEPLVVLNENDGTSDKLRVSRRRASSYDPKRFRSSSLFGVEAADLGLEEAATHTTSTTSSTSTSNMILLLAGKDSSPQRGGQQQREIEQQKIDVNRYKNCEQTHEDSSTFMIRTVITALSPKREESANCATAKSNDSSSTSSSGSNDSIAVLLADTSAPGLSPEIPAQVAPFQPADDVLPQTFDPAAGLSRKQSKLLHLALENYTLFHHGTVIGQQEQEDTITQKHKGQDAKIDQDYCVTRPNTPNLDFQKQDDTSVMKLARVEKVQQESSNTIRESDQGAPLGPNNARCECIVS